MKLYSMSLESRKISVRIIAMQGYIRFFVVVLRFLGFYLVLTFNIFMVFIILYCFLCFPLSVSVLVLL